MSQADRRSLWTSVLVGLTLLVVAGTLLGLVVPMAECPLCKGGRRWTASAGSSCVLCEGRGKVILIKLLTAK
jgi:hypothetical protein